MDASPPDQAEEAELTIRQRKGRLGGHHNGRFVLLGQEFARSAEVRPRQRWRVRLHPNTACLIAEPIEKVDGDAQEGLPPNEALEVPRVHGPMKLQGGWIEPHDVIQTGDRVAFFIDANHTMSAARSLGFKLDWQKVLDYFLADGTFADARIYIGEWPDGSTNPLMEALSHIGYTLRRKPVKFISHSEKQTARLSHDIEIALDMINTIMLYDVAYVFSGDSDLEPLVAHLRSRGKRIHVVNSRSTLSRELAMTSNKPVYLLEDHRNLLTKQPSTTEGHPSPDDQDLREIQVEPPARSEEPLT